MYAFYPCRALCDALTKHSPHVNFLHLRLSVLVGDETGSEEPNSSQGLGNTLNYTRSVSKTVMLRDPSLFRESVQAVSRFASH